MNFSNPLEIIIAFTLVVFTIWMIERIIAGAFKTVVIGIIIALVFVGVKYHKEIEQLISASHPTP